MKTTIIFFIGLLSSFNLFAQPGTIDKSFGENGQVITSFGDGSVTVYKGLIQTDNKIIAVGQYDAALPPYNGFIAIRYTPDGSIDSSFGDNGKTIISDPSQNLITSSASLQKDGKILIAGHGVVGLFDPIFTGVLIRLNTDGSLDSSFGKNGFAYNSIDPTSTSYTALTTQPDGKCVGVGALSNSQFVNRLLENGSPDPSFGTNGFVFIPSTKDRFFVCKIQQDEKIVIGGDNSVIPEKFLLKRFQANGDLDSTFGLSGTVSSDLGQNGSVIIDMAFHSDGKIVTTGETGIDFGIYRNIVARYNVDGTLDKTFGENGVSNAYFQDSLAVAQSVIIQVDNKILLGGNVFYQGKNNYGLARLTPDGSLDPSFGINGETNTNFINYAGSRILSIGLQTSGKIVAVGISSDAKLFKNVSLARYDNDNDKSKRQIIITKIKHWLQRGNGFTWDVNSQVNSYVVQRSYDGIHFSSITKIYARNTSNSYSDPLPLNGNNYYRLQTTSINGAVNYSNVIAVIANEDAFTISPNPANDKLQIQGLLSSNKAKLTVVDFSGNVKLQAVANNTPCNLSIAALKPGNYLLKIEMNSEVVTKKFVKER